MLASALGEMLNHCRDVREKKMISLGITKYNIYRYKNIYISLSSYSIYEQGRNRETGSKAIVII